MNERVTARVSARTDVGNHREQNEDNFLVADLTARVLLHARFANSTIFIGFFRPSLSSE